MKKTLNYSKLILFVILFFKVNSTSAQQYYNYSNYISQNNFSRLVGAQGIVKTSITDSVVLTNQYTIQGESGNIIYFMDMVDELFSNGSFIDVTQVGNPNYLVYSLPTTYLVVDSIYYIEEVVNGMSVLKLEYVQREANGDYMISQNWLYQSGKIETRYIDYSPNFYSNINTPDNGLLFMGGLNIDDDLNKNYFVNTNTLSYFEDTTGVEGYITNPLNYNSLPSKTTVHVFSLNNSSSIDKINFYDDVTLYPNPVVNICKFKTKNFTNPLKSYSIINNAGIRLKTGKFIDDEIDLSFLNPGIYIIQLKSKSQNFSKRVIKY